MPLAALLVAYQASEFDALSGLAPVAPVEFAREMNAGEQHGIVRGDKQMQKSYSVVIRHTHETGRG